MQKGGYQSILKFLLFLAIMLLVIWLMKELPLIIKLFIK